MQARGTSPTTRPPSGEPVANRSDQPVDIEELQCQLRDLLCLAVVGDHIRWVLAGDETTELAGGWQASQGSGGPGLTRWPGISWHWAWRLTGECARWRRTYR
jgi:hypothetical protein